MEIADNLAWLPSTLWLAKIYLKSISTKKTNFNTNIRKPLWQNRWLLELGNEFFANGRHSQIRPKYPPCKNKFVVCYISKSFRKNRGCYGMLPSSLVAKDARNFKQFSAFCCIKIKIIIISKKSWKEVGNRVFTKWTQLHSSSKSKILR